MAEILKRIRRFALSKSESSSPLKNTIVNTFYLFFVQGLNYLLPLLTIPFLLSRLDGDSFGIYIYAVGFVQFLVVILDFGFNLTGTKKISELPLSSQEIVDTYFTITITKFYIFFLLSFFSIIALITIPLFDTYNKGILFAWIGLFGAIIFPPWFFQGINEMKKFSLINAVSKFLTYPFIFLFVNSPTDYWPAIFFQNLSMFVAGIISIFFIYKKSVFTRFDRRSVKWIRIKESLTLAWPIFLSNSITSLMSSSPTIVLGFFTSPFAVGAFGAIDKLVKALCFSVYSPVSQAFFPVIARLKVENITSAKRMLKFAFYLIFLLMLSMILLYFSFEKVVIQRFFSEYIDLTWLLRLSICAIVPIALGGVCGQLGLLALGNNEHKVIFSKIYIYVGTISFPISIVVIYFMKVEGAVLSMILNQLTIFILMYWYTKKFKLL